MAIGEQLNWNVDLEVNLFHAMRKHKPIGVNRHFQMMCIHDRINAATQKKISTKQIWAHLANMYDISALHESEIVPFPNKELEFQLPKIEYGDSMQDEFPRNSKVSSTGDEDSKSKVQEVTDTKEGKTLKPTDKSHERVLESAKLSDDSPKRKRTRQATQSPASVENFGKRTRRN